MMSESSARGLRLAVGSPARIMDADGSARRCVELAADAPGNPAADRPDHSRTGAPAPASGNQRRFRSHLAERTVQGHHHAQRIGDRSEHRARSKCRACRDPGSPGAESAAAAPAAATPHPARSCLSCERRRRDRAGRAGDRPAVPADGRREGIGPAPSTGMPPLVRKDGQHPAARGGCRAAQATRK